MTEQVRVSRRETQQITRAKLRQAAAEAFAQHGFSGCTIDAIANAAGYTRGAFYANYSSKYEVLQELLEEIKGEELSALEALVSTAADFDAAIEGLRVRIDKFMAGGARLKLSVELALEAMRNEAFRASYERSNESILQQTMVLIETLGQKAGAEDLDARTAAIGLRALWFGLAFVQPSPDFDAGRFIADHLRSVLRGAAAAA